MSFWEDFKERCPTKPNDFPLERMLDPENIQS